VITAAASQFGSLGGKSIVGWARLETTGRVAGAAGEVQVAIEVPTEMNSGSGGPVCSSW
jgi:hypothetical protein